MHNTHLTVALTILILLLSGVGYSLPFNVYADPPAWVGRDVVTVEAFRSEIEILPQDLAVPTVIEVPIPTGSVQHRQAVVVSDRAEVAPALFVSDRDNREVSVTLSGTMPNADFSVLTDEDFDTSLDFPFEEGAHNLAYITIVADAPITTSEVRLTLAPNVSLPRTVSIQTTEGESITGTLVATRPLEGTRIRFPETTAQQFTITFDCAQPLRLAELMLVQTDDAEWTEGVRFLAQPDTGYHLYLDPDRSFGTVSDGGVDLHTSTGVREVTGDAIMQPNPHFSPADSDTDGVPDERDNCVQISNTDQIDVDRNARGDACDDFDRDGVVSAQDNCPEDPNWGQEDTDGDGKGDVCDGVEDRFTERNPWVPWFGMFIAAAVLVGMFLLTLRGRPGAHAVGEDVREQAQDV